MATNIDENISEVMSPFGSPDRRMLEESAYPIEFLNAMTDTVAKALQDYLERSEAPKEVIGLLEDLIIMNIWIGEVEKGGPVKALVNQWLMETIANATRNIVTIGGVFYSPSGTSYRRELQDKCQNQLTPNANLELDEE